MQRYMQFVLVQAQRSLHEMNQQPFPGTQWAIKLGVDKDYVPPHMMRASNPTPTHQANRSVSPGYAHLAVHIFMRHSHTASKCYHRSTALSSGQNYQPKLHLGSQLALSYGLENLFEFVHPF